MDLSAATDRSGDEPAPELPSVADYWPDRPGTPIADRPQPEAPPRPGKVPRHAAEASPQAVPVRRVEPVPSRGRVRLTPGGAMALVLLVVVGVVLAIFIKHAQSQSASSAAPAATPQASAAPPVPTGPALVVPAPAEKSASPQPPVQPPKNAETTPAPKLPAAATFEVAATAASVTVRSQNLGADLYRVTLAKAATPVTAKVGDAGANHRLTLVKDPKTTAPPVTITLNAGVRWNLRLTAGNSETTANLTQSNLASLELAGGAHVFNLTLPPVTGTLPLRVTHGMNQLKIKTNGLPVRLTLDDGAGTVVVDGETHTAIKPGTVFTSDGWSAATNRVDLDAVEGVGTLTVDTD